MLNRYVQDVYSKRDHIVSTLEEKDYFKVEESPILPPMREVEMDKSIQEDPDTMLQTFDANKFQKAYSMEPTSVNKQVSEGNKNEDES